MTLTIKLFRPGGGCAAALRGAVGRAGLRAGAAATASGLAIAVAACGSSGSSTTSASSGKVTSVPIGIISELSGSNASAGLDTLRGAELAVQVINGSYPGLALPFAAAKGLPGLHGATIKLDVMDTQGSPQTSASDVSQLVSADHVAAIEGSYSSADTETASATADRLGVPFVNAVSSAVSLTQRGLKWFFRVGPTDLTFGQQMFTLVAHSGQPVHRIAILHTNDTYGDGVDQVTKQLAAEAGYEVVADVGYDATSTTDLTPQVTAIRAASPDVLFDSSYTSDAVLLMQTLNRLDYYPKMLLGYGAGFSDPTFLPTLKSMAEGVMSRAAWSVEIPNKSSQMVAAMFQKEYGRPMTENSARSFTATMALATAINNAGSLAPDSILSALESVNIPGKDLIMPWSGVKFDSDHQNVDATGIVQQVQGSKYDVIFPSQYAVAKLDAPLGSARTMAF